MFLNRIAHYNPPFRYPQQEVGQILKKAIGLGEKEGRLCDIMYRKSGIDRRYSVIGDLDPNYDGERLFFDENQNLLPTPDTGQRNAVYEKYAREGYVECARKILEVNEVPAEAITHVITVSCTGFYAPGPEYDIVQQLGMKPYTERYHLGFMGCYAAFPALRMAHAFLNVQSDAKVLVLCLELCSIHLQFTDGADELLSGSLFADGAAGTLCTNEPLQADSLEWLKSDSRLIGEGEADMAWRIGAQGFDMKLSSYVPKLLEKHGQDVLEAAFPEGIPNFDIYALHPGGSAIVQKMQQLLSEPDESLQYSRKILREYGNMSSVTILFVLEEVQKALKAGQKTLAMGFGPGLTVETALLQKVDA